MKFRKKPVVIEAVQYTEYGKLVKGMCNSQSCYTSGNTEPHVHTIHNNQMVLLEVGDYVIPEPDGEHYYPCKPDIFEKTYDEVNDEVDNRGDVEQPEKKESFRARMARLTAKNANRGGPLYQQIIDSIDREARKGNYEIWWYVELSADLIKRLKEDGFVVGEQQWDRNEYLIKISW